MVTIKKLIGCCLLTLLCLSLYSASVFGLTIEQIQYTAAADGTSPEAGNTVNCAGGIVIGMYAARNDPRIQIYDPDNPDGWGTIQVVDLTSGHDLFGDVSLGDWVFFQDVYVNDSPSESQSRGTTVLEYTDTASHDTDDEKSVSSSSLPGPLVVSASDIAAPAYIGPNPGDWEQAVGNHSAEKYESMLLKIEGITVTHMDLGKAGDNYNLQSSGADNVWASDYLNEDATGDYHASVFLGQHFESVTGMLEQYTKTGTDWDYYQLLTGSGEDLVIPEPASLLLLVCGAGWLLSRRSR